MVDNVVSGAFRGFRAFFDDSLHFFLRRFIEYHNRLSSKFVNACKYEELASDLINRKQRNILDE